MLRAGDVSRYSVGMDPTQFKFFLYARKSTDQSGVADEARSVTRQIEHARAYAARKGWAVLDEHVYVDDGISGAEFRRRPGFLRLMNALSPSAPFEVLIVSEPSRLGREMVATQTAMMQLAEAGIYEKIELPARFGGATLPDIGVLDLREEQPERGHWLAPRLVKEMEARLAKGEQSLLFLNRRGYAPLTLCRNCGFRFQCPNCTAWLVEHRLSRRLACHHCGHEAGVPETCPECGTPDCLVACGPGVERIADEVAERLPTARVAVVTSDTLNSPERIGEFVAAAEEGLIDVIVGTQLVTKGYHFPELTLVGVVDADLGLEGGDLRAGERTYQQIAQVAGRAGRGEKPGEVLIQTRHPEAAVIAALAAGDRDAFYDAETRARRDAGAPPFGRWAAIIVSSEDEAEAREAARAIGGSRPNAPDVMILGPAPAPMAQLRGRYRYRLLINARRSAEVQRIIREWLDPLRLPPGVRVAVDVDPYSFV